MAQIDFPNSPSINDTFTVGNLTWIWTGVVWDIVYNDVSTAVFNTQNNLATLQNDFNIVQSGYNAHIVNTDHLYTWTNTSVFTAGQKFTYLQHIYTVRNGQTLNTGESPITHPHKVDKMSPFSTYKFNFITNNTGGTTNEGGNTAVQNWFYDSTRDKYVLAGGNTSDNVYIFSKVLGYDFHENRIIVSAGHDVARVMLVNDEYWAINQTTAGTLQITRIDANTNTVITTFTSTYLGTLNNTIFVIYNNNVYYTTAQSGTTRLRLYEIELVTFTTTLRITGASSSFTYSNAIYDLTNGVVISLNDGGALTVYSLTTFAALASTTLRYRATGGGIIQPIFASDGNQYYVIPQVDYTGSSPFYTSIIRYDPTTYSFTRIKQFPFRSTGNLPYSSYYDPSNPDWSLICYYGAGQGRWYFINVITFEVVEIIRVYDSTAAFYIEYKDKKYTYFHYVAAAGTTTIRQLAEYDFR